MTTFKLNQKVPGFKLNSISEETFSLSEILEKSGDQWNLMIYFRGSWCPACMAELDDLEKNLEHFEKQNVRITTITHDQKEDLQKVAQEHNWSFPVLLDEDLEFLESYGVHFHGEEAPYEDHGTHGEPAYFLIDEKGKLLYQQRQTSPFGRPHSKELGKIIKYIKENLR